MDTFSRSCHRSAPLAILCSLLLDFSACLSSGWLLGYYGDVVVLRLSPSSSCSLRCFRCQESKPFFVCSGTLQLSYLDGNETSLDVYSLTNHLQYWTMIFLLLGFLSCSLFVSDLASRLWRIRDNKEETSMVMIKMATITCLAASMLSSIVQAIMTYESLDPKRLSASLIGSDQATLDSSFPFEAEDLMLSFGWPYHVRCVSILLVCCIALPLIISKLCSRKSLVLLVAAKNLRSTHRCRGDGDDDREGLKLPPPSDHHHPSSDGHSSSTTSTATSTTSPKSNSSIVSSPPVVGFECLEFFGAKGKENVTSDDRSKESLTSVAQPRGRVALLVYEEERLERIHSSSSSSSSPFFPSDPRFKPPLGESHPPFGFCFPGLEGNDGMREPSENQKSFSSARVPRKKWPDCKGSFFSSAPSKTNERGWTGVLPCQGRTRKEGRPRE